MRALASLLLLAVVGCRSSGNTPTLTVACSPPGTVEEAAGTWSGPGWGRVTLRRDGTGTYTDTYGTGPGRIEFRAVGDGYAGRWMESSQRFGTLRFTLAPDGREIVGAWAPDPACTIGTPSGASLRWTRAPNPES